ncbi:TIGR00252 family protein [Acinetobacter marinus]|uniref:UPF0102 protein SAMN05421749_103475 n=1 Tax=Acinetobacter marinus TaxID=281375 RepID=A0A1G6JW34_9GAMM|nr:YraN family protein [Acinetobacter marinus]SDC22962.1 TIGR00252 family protein [Acinetobacter marinus]
MPKPSQSLDSSASSSSVTRLKKLTLAKLIGNWAEDFALHYLQQHGLQLIQRNYHCRFGEIDLIMQDQHCLCFIEVRARALQSWVAADESVNLRKQQKTIKAAQYFLQQDAEFEAWECRFDVVAIGYDPQVLAQFKQQFAVIQRNNDKKLLQHSQQLARLSNNSQAQHAADLDADQKHDQCNPAIKTRCVEDIQFENLTLEKIQLEWIQHAYLSEI